MSIFMDFDGVIIDSKAIVLNIINRRFKTNYKSSDIKHWDFREVKEVGVKYITDIFNSSDFFNEAIEYVIDDSIKIIRKICNNTDVICNSKGEYMNLGLKMVFIKRFMPFIKDFIALCDMGGESYIGKQAINMKDSAFIDDNLKNLETSNAKVKILFSLDGIPTDYNNYLNPIDGIHTIVGYDKLLEFLEENNYFRS